MFTICFDTICDGYTPVMCDELPIEFATEEEAEAEIKSDPEFYDECFVCPMSEIGHKTIYHSTKKE